MTFQIDLGHCIKIRVVSVYVRMLPISRELSWGCEEFLQFPSMLNHVKNMQF